MDAIYRYITKIKHMSCPWIYLCAARACNIFVNTVHKQRSILYLHLPIICKLPCYSLDNHYVDLKHNNIEIHSNPILIY